MQKWFSSMPNAERQKIHVLIMFLVAAPTANKFLSFLIFSMVIDWKANAVANIKNTYRLLAIHTNFARNRFPMLGWTKCFPQCKRRKVQWYQWENGRIENCCTRHFLWIITIKGNGIKIAKRNHKKDGPLDKGRFSKLKGGEWLSEKK